jgi:hypothetical protein
MRIFPGRRSEVSVAHTSLKGTIFCDAYRAWSGLTLVVPAEGSVLRLIDMKGRSVHRWDAGRRLSGHAELLPNGHILCAAKDEASPLAAIDGAGGVLLELDWEGNVVWEYADPLLHDGCFRTAGGNTLVIKWTKVPEETAPRVRGGAEGSERKGVMWGDVIQEVTPAKEVAWSWTAHEHLNPQIDISCALCPRVEWTHAVSCLELPDGNILACFRKNDTVAVIGKETGEILWRWGKGELAHPQHASLLDNGNVLLFDSGYHRAGINMANSRVVEVVPYSDLDSGRHAGRKSGRDTEQNTGRDNSRETGRVAWSYTDGVNQLFYSSGLSGAQRLPNGNTLVCEGVRGRLFEVTPEGHPVWEYVNHLSGEESDPTAPRRHFQVYSAQRYGMDYSGLAGNKALPAKRQAAPGTVFEVGAEEEAVAEKADDQDAVLKRLQQLGY